MRRRDGRGLGWQGWLWLVIVAVGLSALALGLGYRNGNASREESADPLGATFPGTVAGVSQTIDVFAAVATPGIVSTEIVPVEQSPRSSDGFTPELAAAVPVSSAPGAIASTGQPATSDTTPSYRTSTSVARVTTTSTTATTAATTTTTSSTSADDGTETDPSSTITSVGAESTREPAPTTTIWSGPVAADDHLDVDEGKEAKPDVLDNDVAGTASLDEDTLTIVGGPANAEKYRVHDDHLHYRPAEGFVGLDRIRYRICDTEGRCDTATVVITVG